jgi:hypothetical protein
MRPCPPQRSDYGSLPVRATVGRRLGRSIKICLAGGDFQNGYSRRYAMSALSSAIYNTGHYRVRPWREGRSSAPLALSRAAPRRLRGRVEADEFLHRRDEPLAQFRRLDNLGVGAERDQTGRGPLDRLDRDRDADPAVGIRRRRRLGGRQGDERAEDVELGEAARRHAQRGAGMVDADFERA